MPPHDRRRRDLAEIHMLKKELGLDDETYQALLGVETGKTSSAQMTDQERYRVLRRMRREAGTKRRDRATKNRPVELPEEPMLQKVEALLAEQKLPWNYAHSIAKRMYGVDRLDWCNPAQLAGVITALVKRGKKQGFNVWDGSGS